MMAMREHKLNSSFTVPIGWIWALVSAFGGVLCMSVSIALWLARVDTTTQTNRVDLDALKAEKPTTAEIHVELKDISERMNRQADFLQKMLVILQDTDRRTSRIEGRLERGGR